MLLVYYGDISGLDPAAEPANFSDYRRGRLSSMSSPRQRQQGIGAELLLQRAIRDVRPDIALPPEISLNEYGKPRLDCGVHFSLSHSGVFSACALYDRELGLDIQGPRPFSEALIRREFRPLERERIESAANPDLEAARLWALKESYIKAIGTGFNTALSSFEINCGEPVSVNTGRRCGFWEAYIEGCCFALCVLGDGSPRPDVVKKIKLL